MSLLAFTPSGASITLALTTTQAQGSPPGTGRRMRFVNAGPGNAFIGFFEAGTTPPSLVAANALLLLAGAIEVFSVASDTTQVAAMADASGTSLNVTRGEGQ